MNESNPFKRLFFWLSGAGTETLELCPAWEQRKYVAFGATVLVPCAFAFIACSYALSTLTDNPKVIYPVAAVWAFIILTIDRALLAGYRPFMSWWRKLSQFSLRLIVAILMGLTIAHPLVLLLFRDTINTVVEEERSQEISQERGKFAVGKDRVRTEITKLEEAIAAQREKWNETFQAKFIMQEKTEAAAAIPGLTAEQQTELKAATDEATKPFKDRLDAINTQADELSPQYTKLQSELGFWQAEFERELNGQRSGMKGEGPRARSIRADQLEPRREESKRLGALLEHLTAEKATLQTQVREAEKGAISAFEAKLAEIQKKNKAEEDRVAALKQQVEQNQADSFVTQQNALRETIKQQIDTRLQELERAQNELAAVATEEANRVAAIQAEPRKDILTQTLALHGLFKEGSEGGQFAFATYLVLTLLFMLVDTIPLIVKFFTKPGPYDTLLDRDEIVFDGEHRAFRTSHRRYMESLSAGNLLAVTRNKRLENALVDGVEHSRAAQEFLDSLIQMEKSFAEKIRMEQEEARHAGPEKLAALEAIKKRFYEDMQRRMEAFFAGQHA
ncbi:DUF4407 domain-containing protein [Luteolibacter luteus]|uniref:DUF4407 domain-containing protein n=1 Tax=Luteolibacter luteus TaxID=2728835 RepID=A0A858REV2_9BACT|nr:DUF4407 domain-containing protein [Luteolibacter luteus]QJE94949.1 DUF4407 domain-containing protein [Luteolibacter luteus]